MESLLTTFVAAFLAEWGDKTQLLVIALSARFQRPAAVLAAVALAALANSALAAFAGGLVHDYITLRAISLLLALSLIVAGGAGLFRDKVPDMGSTWRVGAFLTTLGCFFLLELFDKTTFMTMALSAQYDAPILAAAGAAVGITVANAPASLLGPELAKAVPLRWMRLGIGLLFLLVGLIVAVNALRLV